jgi:threonine dehydrogenase-like Zn-dependent dehydrogenase
MKALQFSEKLELVDLPIPEPAEDEALIRVKTAGICRTDLEIIQGYMGFTGVLGHEFVGVVEECVSCPQKEGTRVCGEINLAPWTNDSVQQRHDPNRIVLGVEGKDGCFAEYLTLPAQNLFTVPDSISDDQAVFVEPLAAACEILEQVHVQPMDKIAVLGDGRLGLLCAQVLSLVSSQVLLIGRHKKKLELAKDFALKTYLSEDLTEEDESAFDMVVDCTGKPDGLTTSLRLTRPRGTLILKTTTAVPPDFNTAEIVIKEITLVGSRCGRFPAAIELLHRNLVNVNALIEKKFPLLYGLEAFEYAKQPGVIKVLLENKL